MQNQTKQIFVFLSLFAALIILSLNSEISEAAVENCTQNWTLNETWSSCISFTHTKNYYDANECDNLTGQPADITEPCGAVIDCILPINDSSFDSTRVAAKINNTLDINLKHIKYSIDGGYWRVLCNNCSYWSGNLTFSEGVHALSIKTITYYDETEDYCNSAITVDSIPPYVISQAPLDEAYTSGLFSVLYNEVNLVGIDLYYKGIGETSYQTASLENCESGKNKECSKEIDLSSYNNQQINYYFNLSDVMRSETSDVYTVKVDTEEPSMIVTSPVEDGSYNKVPVIINLDEEVDSLQYSDNGQSYIKLCRDCNSYNQIRTFSDGIHTITIKAADYAGNEAYSNVTFLVDSKKPRIIKQTPVNGKYTNGLFSVLYTEANVIKTTLYYTDNLSNGYLTEEADCESGIKKQCNISLDLSEYDGKPIYYYFNITDPITSYSKALYMVYVDFTPPEIDLTLPESITYDNSYVPIRVNMSEQVKYLYYSDNNSAFKRLCSRCSNYYKSRPFLEGQHNLTIKAVDDAGNEAFAYQTFIVDY